MKTKLFWILCTALFFMACSKGSSGGGGGAPLDCSSVPKSFSTDVNPIIQGTCNQASCHNAGSTNGPGPLTDYNQVFNARSAIRTAIANGTMPKNTSLTTAQRNSIICWIDSGAPQN